MMLTQETKGLLIVLAVLLAFAVITAVLAHIAVVKVIAVLSPSLIVLAARWRASP